MTDTGPTSRRRTRRAVGRPSRTSLPALLDAATELGLDTFTLGAVARHVGVAEATVYNYVSGRDELFRAACDRLFSSVSLETDADTDTGSWMDYMEVVSARVYPLAVAHPGFADYLFFGPFGPETERIYRSMVEEVMRRRPVLTPNAAYFVASRTFMAALTMANVPDQQDAATWLRHALMLGIEQQINEGNLPELPGEWTEVLESQGPPDRS